MNFISIFPLSDPYFSILLTTNLLHEQCPAVFQIIIPRKVSRNRRKFNDKRLDCSVTRRVRNQTVITTRREAPHKFSFFSTVSFLCVPFRTVLLQVNPPLPHCTVRIFLCLSPRLVASRLSSVFLSRRSSWPPRLCLVLLHFWSVPLRSGEFLC